MIRFEIQDSAHPGIRKGGALLPASPRPGDALVAQLKEGLRRCIVERVVWVSGRDPTLKVSIVGEYEEPEPTQEERLSDIVTKNVLTMFSLYKGYPIEYRSNAGALMSMLEAANPSVAVALQADEEPRDLYLALYGEDE